MEKLALTRNNHVSMYEQIAETLKREIADGKYVKHGYIGTQKELVSRFNVSLITVKKAVEVLVKEDAVYSKQGKGIFIKKPAISDKLNKLTGITNIMQSMNIFPTVKVRNIVQIPTPDYFNDEVKKELGENCLLIERLHFNDKQVIAYAKIYMPTKYGTKFTIDDFQNNTIYQLYQNRLGVKLGKGIQNIRALPSEAWSSEALNIAPCTPLLFVERFSYDINGKLIEAMEMFYEYTQYYFKVELDLSGD
ncbi:MAG: GntR family transcriptional regulator [Defluviitaleaceae bacterium]|nr:GntR family transcriptional regulator [Defluviitaleaceae bacterium]